MASRLREVVRRISKHLNNIFSGISATIALTPIHISDIYIILIIQSVLVALIASLSGRGLSLDAAKEFIFSVGAVDYGFRVVAQQASKLLNAVWPGSGFAISSAVAFTGTYTIGNEAITYRIDEQNIEMAKQKFEEIKMQKNRNCCIKFSQVCHRHN